MERELLKLLDDFRNGKLDAFSADGGGCSIASLDAIRDKQKAMAQCHFNADIIQDNEDRGKEKPELYSSLANEEFDKLMNDLAELGTSIQSLQKQPGSSTSGS